MSLSAEERKAIVDYRIEKSNLAMEEAKANYSLGYFTLAIQRLYYAAYYAASALLIANGFSAQTHQGVKILLGKEFVSKGKLDPEAHRTFSNLLRLRHDGDYDDLFDFGANDFNEYLPKTERLLNAIKTLLTQEGVSVPTLSL